MNNRFKEFVAFVLFLFFAFNFMYGQIAYPIVDTGVKEFYSDTDLILEPAEGESFFGQDANYNGNQPSYINNGDGTISDKITGLMWQQDMGNKMSYADAVEFVKDMSLGGYSDWRIPTIKELYSLAIFTGHCMGETVLDKFIDTNYFVQPIGDVSQGEREIDAQTWSKTHYEGLTMNGDTTIFGYNFVDGRLKGYPKYDPRDKTPMTMYFRMVRENSTYGVNNFIDNKDGTITDKATGLMWQQTDNGMTYNWEDGLNYAENLNLAGYSDWRMPNAKELHSIVDYTRSPSTSSSPAIDPLFYCTSIIDPDGNDGQYGYYWSSSPLKDGPNPYSDAVYICFGKAQGEMNGNLMDVHGAGAQRNDPKSGDAANYPDFFGPQGDVRYVYNFVRCVRDVNSSTSINNDEINNDIRIFPIPANNTLNIICSEPYKIKLTNVLGEEVYSRESCEGQMSVDISSYNDGCYIIQFKSEKGSFTRKIIIK